MHSDMIGKIEKARRYAEEPERVQISELTATFRGTNDTHLVTLKDGKWQSDAPSFDSWGTSVHIMTMQRLLDPMLVPEARQSTVEGVHMHSDLSRKIEKARRYAEEPERVQISELTATFQGANSEHVITLKDGQWHSDDAFFRSWGTTAHIMALQRMLGDMLIPEARQPEMALDVPDDTASI